MQELTYKLELFEGPLELLLSLVNKNKMDINDIQISVICEQYMDYIEEAQKMDMELASEFIVMASELMLIKSRMLLPKLKEDEEDPRAWLSEALTIYKKAKEAAQAMLPMYAEYSGRMIKDEDEIPPDKEIKAGLDPELLSRALSLMMRRLEASENVQSTHIKPLVRARVVSVEERIGIIVNMLKQKKRYTLLEILDDAKDRSELIASFLALLELIKSRTVLLCSQQDTDPDERGELSFDIDVALNPDQSILDNLPKSEIDEDN